MTLYLLKDSAVEGVWVATKTKQTVPLRLENPDHPIGLADLPKKFKYNVWRRIAKHLGLAATGKLQDIVDRVIAAWLERGDLVQFVPGGEGVESIPSNDANDPSASPVPSGGTNDPVVPRESTIADGILADPDVLNRFQMDSEGAARDILGDEASPVLVANTADLLRQGLPGIEFLLSSPTPRRKEAAMILLEGALLRDTTMACAEAVLSVPGIPDFITADPSNASLLFLGTNPPSDLVEEVSDYLSSESFQAILHHSTASAASNLDNMIATHTAEAARIAALRNEGRELYLERRYQESVVQYSSALSYLRIRTRIFTVTPMTPRLGQNDLKLAQILGNRAAALLMVGAYDAAVSDCSKGLEQIPDTTVWDLKVGSGPALRCRLLGRLGRALLKAGKEGAAEKASDDTIRIADEAFARYGRDSVDPKAVTLLDRSIANASLNKTDARRLRVEKSEINKLCSSLPPNVAAKRYGAQILAHVKTALELAPGDVELHSYIVQLFAGMKRWADLALHCERFASACVKFDGVFVGDLTGLNPYPSAPLAQTLKSDHFDLSVWDLATNAPKLLSEEAVGEAVLRMPMSMLPLYLRALRLEERYAEGERALSVLLASAREGNLADYPITLLEREQKKRIRTCTAKDDGDVLFRQGQYKEAAAKYAACLLIDAEGEEIATADGSNAGGRLHAVLHCNRVACFMVLKLYREASMECAAALRIHAQYMKAKLRLARCLRRLQRYEEAVREYHHWIFLAEAAEQNPQSAIAEYDAACYFDKPSDTTPDDIKKARVELNEAVKAKNSRAEAEANARARAQRHYQQQQQRSQSNRQQQSETSAPREGNPKGRTPYEVLGVSRDATVAQIKKAYHKMALKHHPDKGGTGEDFLPIKQAYDELCARAARTDGMN